MKAATIDDVAKEAGVSITTVSRVINNNYPVSTQTRQKVQAAIEKLNFTPNALARGLIQKKTNTIGVLIPSIANMYFTVVVSGIQDYLRVNGYHILLSDTGGDAKSELMQLKSLKERLVDGIISIDPRTINIRNGAYSELCRDIPAILINGYNQGMKLNYLLNDQESGTVEALNYLIGLNHKEIAFLRGEHSYSYDLKEDAYRRILAQNEIEVRDENILTIENGNSIETAELACYAFEKRFSICNKQAKKITAILCCNDFMAVGVLNAAQKLGLNVPRDLSVIGYDNVMISEITMPKLTTVDQNMYRLGKIAAEQLNALINQPEDGKIKIILDTNLIIRESCAKV